MEHHVEIMRDANGSVVSDITAAVEAVVVDEAGARSVVRFEKDASAQARLAAIAPPATAAPSPTPKPKKA